MENKTNLYVFAKKEVLLIFIFMILISATSFLLGVKIGTNYSYDKAGLMSEDKQSIDIMSPVEELVSEIAHQKSQNVDDSDAVYEALKKKTSDSLSRKMEDEFSNENKRFSNNNKSIKEEIDNSNSSVAPQTETSVPKQSRTDEYAGKYTIQIGSYSSSIDAKEFANGYKIRGYSPIINPVELEHRGTWYRVSLGVFPNVSEVKEYIIANKSLFTGSDYVIVQF